MSSAATPTPRFISGYWGKTDRDGALDPVWHPLAYHCLDVAAVAEELLLRSPRRVSRLAHQCSVDDVAVRRVLSLLVALHDIGKFSTHFQAKSALGPRRDLPPAPVGVRHDAIGYEMLAAKWSGLGRHLAAYFNIASDHERGIWAAVTGHHGAPAMEARGWSQGFGSAEQKDVGEFVSAMTRLLPPTDLLPPLGKRARVLSWAVAGLTNLCDWIGSNQKWFRYRKPEHDLDAYWTHARTAARTALDEAGILPADAPTAVQPELLLPHLGKLKLSPLQQQALDCDLGQGPVLALVEDVTGAGKTEAALLIAARLMAERRADGLFFALPTMATANAMYSRLTASYRRLFAENADPSLVLAHGRRGLNDGFRSSILAADGNQQAQGAARIETLADETASAACAAWIADDRRKAFLAHVGIGTIDQALLGVLPSRFQSLRLWGLSDRVLVIDEAHSFDAYVSREMETLLEFHAALGGSAVVLSATLSIGARQKLADAFARGLGCKPSPITASDYPMLTVIGQPGTVPVRVDSRTEVVRSLDVRRLETFEQATDHAVAMAGRGACVAWIRNTVDDTIAAMQAFKGRGIEPILLHARFAMGDRLAIEKDVQDRLGKGSTPQMRRDKNKRGLVLVGSQILEQSLDYDVDAMISDLAPVDMIIQRAGRLWRHPTRNAQRPITSEERALMLLSPDPHAVNDRDWFRAISKGAAAVYPDHGLVWLSARALLRERAIRTPDGIRDLLAAVYDEQDHGDIPEVLLRATFDADGKRRAARSIAGANCLDVWQGYGGDNAIWNGDTITPTRLGEPVVAFRLAKRVSGRIVPWTEADTPQRSWALSECTVRKAMASGVPLAGGALAREIDAAKSDWPTWEQEQPLLLLESDGDIWRGTVVDKDNRERSVLYDNRIGWRLAAQP